jgi:hypothetical protein
MFSFLLSLYWRLEARTIRRCGDHWPLHAPGQLLIADFLIVD